MEVVLLVRAPGVVHSMYFKIANLTSVDPPSLNYKYVTAFSSKL